MPDRAVVAVSDDRQWLVVLTPEGRWSLAGWGLNHSGHHMWVTVRDIEDTGQDAHEVLREWMEGRDA